MTVQHILMHEKFYRTFPGLEVTQLSFTDIKNIETPQFSIINGHMVYQMILGMFAQQIHNLIVLILIFGFVDMK